LLNFKCKNHLCKSILNTSTKLIPTAARHFLQPFFERAAPALNLREHQIPLVGRMSQTISIEARMHAVLDAYAHFFRRVPSFTMAHAGLNDRGDCVWRFNYRQSEFPARRLIYFPTQVGDGPRVRARILIRPSRMSRWKSNRHCTHTADCSAHT